MKRSTLFILIVGCMIAGWMLQPVLAGRGKGGGKPAPALSAAEEADLLFMREEEKLAHDVYVTLYAEWGNSVFDNISKSEQRHTDAVLGLISKYNLVDPALDFGYFADPDLQALFNMLVTEGLKSELDALMVGALIEEVDMEDIVDAMERTDKSDILNVYGNLLAGSENHLVSFVKNIEALSGIPYEAQWLTQEEVNAILGR